MLPVSLFFPCCQNCQTLSQISQCSCTETCFYKHILAILFLQELKELEEWSIPLSEVEVGPLLGSRRLGSLYKWAACRLCWNWLQTDCLLITKKKGKAANNINHNEVTVCLIIEEIIQCVQQDTWHQSLNPVYGDSVSQPLDLVYVEQFVNLWILFMGLQYVVL